MYSFLLRPRWLAFLLLGLVGAIGMPMLGQWQVDRYHQRQTINKNVKERAALSPVPVRVLLPPDKSNFKDAAEQEWRQVSATGTYDAAHQVLIDNRSLKSRPGYHVVTPLILDDGRAVLINRGWVPQETAVGAPRPTAVPPTGPVEIVGRLRVTQVGGQVGAAIPAKGTLDLMVRLDVERIAQQMPTRVLPMYVELSSQLPASPDAPQLIPVDRQETGTNLSYAMQWYLFTLVGLIAWPIIIRREAARQAKAKAKSNAGPSEKAAPKAAAADKASS
jgi:cytochrome oxidase assembly protein ShyY1